MHSHGPNCLVGPISRSRDWWKQTPAKSARRRTTRAKATSRRRASSAAIRTDLVERVRTEIAAGTYDTPAKWNMALDRLFLSLEDA